MTKFNQVVTVYTSKYSGYYCAFLRAKLKRLKRVHVGAQIIGKPSKYKKNRMIAISWKSVSYDILFKRDTNCLSQLCRINVLTAKSKIGSGR
jgi:N-acyl-L-homoserine lactone synthetase